MRSCSVWFRSRLEDLILKLDRLAVRPVDFTIRIKEIADTMPEGYAEGQEELRSWLLWQGISTPA
ncbi:MAG: hypothetical protein V8S42_09265 [Lachnospiraceae bacterium]